MLKKDLLVQSFRYSFVLCKNSTIKIDFDTNFGILSLNKTISNDRK